MLTPRQIAYNVMIEVLSTKERSKEEMEGAREFFVTFIPKMKEDISKQTGEGAQEALEHVLRWT
jgi:hypothetical protein